MKHDRKGFTLAEMLAAVAILAVLCAVAIPGVNGMKKSLTKQRLDDTAREIYMAAQNRLTALKAAGTEIPVPSGQPDLYGVCCLVKGDPGMETLLPSGSVEGSTAAANYVIWFNKDTGNVLKVDYSEKYTGTQLHFGISDNEGYGQYPDEEIENIKEDKNQNPPDNTVTNIPLPAPIVTIDNGDKLTLTVKIEDPTDPNLSGATLTVSIEGIEFYTNDNAGTYTTQTWTLDSLDSGKQFKDFIEKYKLSITPGSDITVEARVTKASTDQKINYTEGFHKLKSRKTANSLFASVSSGTAEIENLRHLQNLSNAYSGVEDITEANLLKDIECSENAFTAINTGITFNGNNRTVSNLKSAAGLFDGISGGKIKNLILVNPVIDGTGNAGALAGSLTNTTVENCQVYGTGSRVSGSGSVGGLIGSTDNCTVSGCSASVISVSGTTAGGLIGSMSGGTVTSSYADSGDRGGTNGGWRNGVSGTTAGGLIGSISSGSISHCYASGYVSGFIDNDTTTGGGLIGSCNDGSISDSYTIVTVYAVNKGGIAGSGNPTCTNVYFWRGGCSGDTGGSGIGLGDIAKLCTLTGWSSWRTATEASTQAYHNVHKTNAYPYPVIENLTHYGDWSEETISDIYVKQNGQKINVILCPKGKSVTVQLEARNGEEAGKQTVKVDDPVPDAVQYSLSPDMSGGAINMTLGSDTAGIYTLDLSCESIKVRTVLIVYSADIILNCGDVKNETKFGQTQEDVHKKDISSGETLTAIASLRTTPTKDQIQKAYQNIAEGASDEMKYTVHCDGDGIVMEADAKKILDDWESIVAVNPRETVTGPGVTVNQEIDASAKIYVLLKENDASKAQYPYSLSGNQITVVGQSAGTAEISADWAMDNTVTVRCPITVSGARIFIKTATGKGVGSGNSWTTDNFPYKLTCTPVANEKITISLTTQLYGVSGGSSGTYTWTVKKNGYAMSAGCEVTKNGSGAEIAIAETPSEATYRIEVKYQSGSYTTTDYVYVHAVRKAASTPSGLNSPITLSSPTVSLEQVASGNGYSGLNEKTVCARVDGADDDQLLWYLDVNENGSYDSGDTLLSGMDTEESVPISDTVNGKSMVIAEVFWSEKEGATPTGSSLGGTVTVRAKDVSYYGSAPLTFKLIARARNNGSDDCATASVTVQVMPKLTISPNTAMARKDGSKTFTANRSVSGWTYAWELSSKSNTNYSSSSLPNSKSVSLSISDYNAERTLTLRYGPYMAKATMGTVGNGQLGGDNNTEMTINYDGTGYFLLEKNETRELEFSWYTITNTGLRQSYLNSEPKLSNGYQTMVLQTGSTGTGTGSRVDEGHRYYEITGTAFGSADATWGIVQQTWLVIKWGATMNSSKTYKLYTVGAEFAADSLTMTGLGSTASVNLSSYFPKAIGIGTMTVTSSDPEVITVTQNGSFSPAGSSVDSRNITVKSVKYGTATVTAEYTIGDRKYVDTVTVKVVPPVGSLTAVLEVCSASEAQTVFGADYSEAKPLYDESGKRLLFSAFGTGYDVLYLKTYLLAGSVKQSATSLIAEADLRFTSSNAVAVSCTPKTIGMDTYLMIRAESGSNLAQNITITADFGGSVKQEYKLIVYDKPDIKITSGGSTVTDRHTVVTASNVEGTSYVFTASLTNPVVYTNASATVPLSVTYSWKLDFPTAGMESYVVLSAKDSSATVTVNQNPLCKVAVSVTASPAASEAAHALVFLPNSD